MKKPRLAILFFAVALALAIVQWLATTAHAQTTAAPATTSEQTTTAPATPTTSWPYITLVASSPRASLQRRDETGSWDDVCDPPCEHRQDPKPKYRVAGIGLIPSDPFSLPEGNRRVEVNARLGTHGKQIAGKVIGGIGVGTFCLDLLSYIVLSGSSSSSTANGSSGLSNDTAKAFAVAGMIVGVAGALIGFSMAAGAQHSTVNVE
jgi:hypothetical protein